MAQRFSSSRVCVNAVRLRRFVMGLLTYSGDAAFAQRAKATEEGVADR